MGQVSNPPVNEKQVENLLADQQQPPLMAMIFASRKGQPASAVAALHNRWAKTGEDEFQGLRAYGFITASQTNW